MNITVDLPTELLHEAMQVFHIDTETEVIIFALERLVQRLTITDLKTYKGVVDLDIDLDMLRDRYNHHVIPNPKG